MADIKTNRECSVGGCERTYSARGLCTVHYRRMWRHGSTDMPASRAKTAKQRFMEKVASGAGCHIWHGATNALGYGSFRLDGKTVPAHRAAFIFAHGCVPEGMVIDHLCHNPSCVNPAHLQAVPQAFNMQNRRGADRNSVTGVRGVTKHGARFRARVRDIHVGVFDTLEEAARAATAMRLRVMEHSDLNLRQS